jgi:ribonuclease Y
LFLLCPNPYYELRGAYLDIALKILYNLITDRFFLQSLQKGEEGRGFADMNIVGIAIASLASFIVGYLTRLFWASWSKKGAESMARKILEDAEREAEMKKREALIEAKEELHRLKSELERQNREKKVELQNLERKLLQREESLNRRADMMDRKEREVKEREKELETLQRSLRERESELRELINKRREELERISGMSSKEAKDLLIESMISEARKEAAVLIRRIEEEAREEAERKAQEIIATAIQRCASEYVAEVSVSVVSLPNEEMKGRIIGREGRNLRAFESATGVDVIIDDTPQTIALSAFDPVRREIARIAMERLISDGRIHPARIEEVVEKVRKEVEQSIIEEGERAVLELGIDGLHPELVRMVGKLKYRMSYAQNVLQHSKEVAFLASMMASELKLDPKLVKRAALLHDIGKAAEQEMQGSHALVGAEIARKYEEPEEVVHAIAAHHGEVEPETLVDILVSSADALSAARPGARRESLERYIKRLERLEAIADSFEGVSKSYAIQAGREIRVVVEPEKISDEELSFLAREIARKIEQEADYPGQVKVVVIKEIRAVDYAK